MSRRSPMTRPPGLTFCAGLCVLCLAAPGQAPAQDGGGEELREGSALVRRGADEYLIRILCDGSQPELGFTTEANRVTRAATGGRSNMVTMRLLPWKDTGDVLISVDGGGQAWVPRPASAGGVLSMDVVLRPGVVVREGQPVAVTYDMWKAGEVGGEETPVHFEANCTRRDPDAPAYRKVAD